MSDQLSIPETRQGMARRRFADACREATGLAFCVSCQQTKPEAEVKRYRPENYRGRGGAVIRCDACQDRRLAYMKGQR